MPGAGKSTVGVILAKKTACAFVDTDVLIQTSQRRTLQDIVDTDGYAVLRKIEEEILLALCVRNNVIATGGSAVYSDRAMTHLKSGGILIFLSTTLSTLESRVGISAREVSYGDRAKPLPNCLTSALAYTPGTQTSRSDAMVSRRSKSVKE